MMNPSKTRYTTNIEYNHFRGSYRTHVNMRSILPNCNIEFDKSPPTESKFYMSSPEEQTECIKKKELFKEYADIGDGTLSTIEGDVKKIIEEYNSNLEYYIDYDIDPEEPIPYLIIKLNDRLPVDEEINFSKYIWKSMRKRGYKGLLRKLCIIVDYE